MSELTEEKLQLEGTWYCVGCRQPVSIVEIKKINGITEEGISKTSAYELIADCPNKHSTIVDVKKHDIQYLTHEDQTTLSRFFLSSLLGELEKKPEKDILTINAVKAMAGITGLTEDECTEVIKRGMEENWVKETQKLILDRITAGEKSLLDTEVELTEKTED